MYTIYICRYSCLWLCNIGLPPSRIIRPDRGQTLEAALGVRVESALADRLAQAEEGGRLKVHVDLMGDKLRSTVQFREVGEAEHTRHRLELIT